MLFQKSRKCVHWQTYQGFNTIDAVNENGNINYVQRFYTTPRR